MFRREGLLSGAGCLGPGGRELGIGRSNCSAPLSPEYHKHCKEGPLEAWPGVANWPLASWIWLSDGFFWPVRCFKSNLTHHFT